jgi:hypothetical protein
MERNIELKEYLVEMPLIAWWGDLRRKTIGESLTQLRYILESSRN